MASTVGVANLSLLSYDLKIIFIDELLKQTQLCTMLHRHVKHLYAYSIKILFQHTNMVQLMHY